MALENNVDASDCRTGKPSTGKLLFDGKNRADANPNVYYDRKCIIVRNYQEGRT